MNEMWKNIPLTQSHVNEGREEIEKEAKEVENIS